MVVHEDNGSVETRPFPWISVGGGKSGCLWGYPTRLDGR